MTQGFESTQAWYTHLKRRFCLFWGVPYSSDVSGFEKLLIETDVRTRRRLTFIQKIPVRLMMAIPLGILCFTRSKVTLLVLLYVVGMVYVPLTGFVGFYFTDRLGFFDQHLRRNFARVRTGMWDRPR